MEIMGEAEEGSDVNSSRDTWEFQSCQVKKHYVSTMFLDVYLGYLIFILQIVDVFILAL